MAELAEFLEEFADRRDAYGRRAVVRNGYLAAREVQTGIGAVAEALVALLGPDAKGLSTPAIGRLKARWKQIVPLALRTQQ